jgi:hypothetical protein
MHRHLEERPSAAGLGCPTDATGSKRPSNFVDKDTLTDGASGEQKDKK